MQKDSYFYRAGRPLYTILYLLLVIFIFHKSDSLYERSMEDRPAAYDDQILVYNLSFLFPKTHLTSVPPHLQRTIASPVAPHVKEKKIWTQYIGWYRFFYIKYYFTYLTQIWSFCKWIFENLNIANRKNLKI